MSRGKQAHKCYSLAKRHRDENRRVFLKIFDVIDGDLRHFSIYIEKKNVIYY